MGTLKRPPPCNIAPDESEGWFYGKKPKPIEENNDPSPPARFIIVNGRRIELALPPQKIRKDTLSELSLGGFETFSKQRFALERMEESRKVFKNTRTFSFEVESENVGERRYLVTSVDRLWPWYSKQPKRNMYELIAESMPCRLYFDLEYSKKANPDINHKAVFEHFTDALTDLLDDVFLLDCNSDKEFLILESSTPQKFSAHLICHLNGGYLFKSNAHMRPFIEQLQKELLKDPPCKIWNDDGKEVVLCDTGVYTKNRNFRMYLSSKLGKDVFLKLADYCKFYGDRTPTEREIFMDSLCVPLDYEKYPILPVDENTLTSIRMPRFATDVTVTNSNDVSNVSHSVVAHAPKSHAQAQQGTGPSPYPQLDEFMLLVFQKYNEKASIKNWKMYTDTRSDIANDFIIYYPQNCRYCFNIAREHKSNGTYWTVNLTRHEFYQRCFDSECRGVRSNSFPLPTFVVKALENSGDVANLDTSLASNRDGLESFLESNEAEISRFFSNWEQVFDS